MANLMVANGMEDENFEREGMLKKYDNEMSNLEKNTISRIPPQFSRKKQLSPQEEVKKLRQKLHAVDEEPAETRYVSRMTVGAESASLGYDFLKGNFAAGKNLKETALSFVSPAKKFLYKVLDAAGLFQPEKVIDREVKKLEGYISKFSEIKDQYKEEVKELDKKIAEAKNWVLDCDKLISELESKVESSPDKKYELHQKLDVTSTSFLESYEDLEDLKEDRKHAVTVMHAIDNQMKKFKQARRSLVGEIKSRYNQTELKKVLEAYENI